VRGCVQSCQDGDGCNGADNHPRSSWLLMLLATACLVCLPSSFITSSTVRAADPTTLRSPNYACKPPHAGRNVLKSSGNGAIARPEATAPGSCKNSGDDEKPSRDEVVRFRSPVAHAAVKMARDLQGEQIDTGVNSTISRVYNSSRIKTRSCPSCVQAQWKLRPILGTENGDD
jgi:hypothetical protein